MLKKLLAALTVAGVCFGPATVLLSVAVLANPAVAACAPGLGCVKFRRRENA